MEARSITSKSPRGAAALLRLVVQKLMPHLGEPGKNLDTDISSPVEKRLDVEVQQSLDACHVVGNNAVHLGALDVNDALELPAQVCDLVNFIVDSRISQPKKIKALYASMPARALAAIEKREEK
jgi:hypothetical protein